MINFSMPRTRSLFLLICTVVLVGGCATAMIELREKTPVCFPPGTVSESKRPCFYNLEIEQIISESVVRVIVPETVLVYNARHSAYTPLGAKVGATFNQTNYGRALYEVTVVYPKELKLKEHHTYEFRAIKGKASLEVIGEARFPEDQGDDQGKKPEDISKNAGTELYATHKPQCCMCGTCQSACVCPGQGNCPWCATTDVNTLIARALINNDTVDVRSGRGLERSSADSGGVAEKFLALMSGSRAHGNISVRFIGNYTYDQKFAPACLTKRV